MSGSNITSGYKDGLTKIKFCPQTRQSLAALSLDHNAREPIVKGALPRGNDTTVDDIALTVHAHLEVFKPFAISAERWLGKPTDIFIVSGH